jgi:tRNA 2-selenouridine synthase
MGIEKIKIEKFIELSFRFPVLDVRSEGEFEHAHIPGAYNLSLFNNEERKDVGTIYKQKSREAAIKKGLDYFGPKMSSMIVAAEEIVAKQEHVQKTVLVHCWRGGMRSAGVAWLLDLYGFKVYTAIGGYKAFRNWVLEGFSKPHRLQILGGYTGSGKTELVHGLENRGAVVIDLEGIAGHKGSAFGNIGLPKQPSQEMFENRLATLLHKKEMEHPKSTIWLEDESQRIGTVNIPIPFWNQMRSSPVTFLDIDFNKRLDYLVKNYGKLNQEELRDAILRIQKRLGGLETKTAVAALDEGNLHACFSILLKYYDKHYYKGLNNRPDPKPAIKKIEAKGVDIENNLNEILKQ